MNDFHLNVPILFMIFRRPESTSNVFAEIRRAAPPRLYIAADGPRPHVPADKELCRQVREITNKVDWPCEVKTLFREKNLGCKYAPSSAVTWFFENEEMGIILEDDCIPHPSFFRYCEELLLEYRNDSRISMIAGANLIDSQVPINTSYCFTRYYSIWGWASWRRAWKPYDVEIKDWRRQITPEEISCFFPSALVTEHYEHTFDEITVKNFQTWDFQWTMCCLFNYGLCITPRVNMITNVGTEGAHFSGASKANFLERKEMAFPLSRPDFVFPYVPFEDGMLHYQGLYDRPFRRKIRKLIYSNKLTTKIFELMKSKRK